ncbi:MAG: hypothetical protein J6Y10_06495 [Lachnospiraceae bacterium]|nr:hypothetical protein [Lachnospiraceae bacterium]
MGKKITILLLSLLLLASLGLAIKEIYSALHPTKDPEVIADLCYGKNGHTDCLVYVKEDGKYKYAAIHIDRPFDNPFVTIPGAYHTLGDFMRTNGLRQAYEGVIPCFETDGESMDVYIACE